MNIKKCIPSSIRSFIRSIVRKQHEREYYSHNINIDKSTTAYMHTLIADIFINDIREGDNVLDIGCGCGYLAHKASEKGRIVEAIDYSKKAIKYAKDRNPGIDNKVNYEIHNVKKILPYNNNQFDVIVIEEVLEHLENPREIILESLRVSKKDGNVLISVPYDLVPADFHISPMNDKTIPVIFSGLTYSIDRPFLPHSTTYIIKLKKSSNITFLDSL